MVCVIDVVDPSHLTLQSASSTRYEGRNPRTVLVPQELRPHLHLVGEYAVMDLCPKCLVSTRPSARASSQFDTHDTRRIGATLSGCTAAAR